VKLKQSNDLKTQNIDLEPLITSCNFCTWVAQSIRKALYKTYALTYHTVKEQFMTTITASEARAGLYRLIDQTAETHKPVLISGKRSNAVLVSEEDWSAIQETLYLLAIPGMRESIKEAMAEPLAKSKRALKW
jgi:prevent-host-death family protein